MSSITRIAVRSLLLSCCIACSIGATGQTATLTVGGAEQSPNGAWDNGNITIDFNGYMETVHYAQYSSPASLASALGAMFTRDYYHFGLRAKAGANQNQDPTVVTFKLTNGSTFGPLNVTGPTSSFNFVPAGFGGTNSAADTGTVVLQVAGTTIASTSYGDGSTATTLAQGLAIAARSNALVTVTADGANLYLQAKQPGSASNYSYTLSATSSNPAAFPAPSFLSTPLVGNLTGGADQNAQGGTVYRYSVTNSSGSSGYDATGNIVNASDSVMGTWQFGYDSLNRLTSGQAANGPYAGQYTCWTYDSFGNRTAQSVSATSCGNSPPSTFWANYSTNNQIVKASTASNGFGYDGAGNVTNDGANTYLYDAESRLCAVHGSQGMIGYQYDAEGHRVGKGTITVMSCDLTANGYLPTNEYVLDQSGGQMTELAVDENGSEVWQHTNVTANGMLIATYDTAGLHFYLNDALGTRRTQTDSAGVPEQNCESLPFGDQLNCTQNLVAPTEHHFTGKERDAESGLDYFGARYYASNMGRWMSPDWAEKAEPVPYAKLDNPQSLNLYGYVLNNPLSRVDADGHEVDLTNTDAKQRAETEKRILSNVNKNERGLFTTTTDKNGTTSLVLNKDAAANFDGKHSSGYNMLNQAIDSKAVASVEINDHPTMPDGHSINTGADAGGGRTVTFANGNSNIYLSTAGDQSGVNLYGMNHQIIPNPFGIIAGHELLGHGRLNMLGRPSGEGPAIGVENQLRKEQGLPLRLTGYN